MSRKIFITGAFGFIGSHLAELCVKKGYHVTAFDRYNSDNNWGWLNQSEVKNDINIILGDIRDYDSVSKAMKGCDSIMHLAALIGIPYSYVSPLAYIRTNIEGTYNILESAKNLNFENILITSTSETYGSAQYVPMDESHPVVGQSPYSASKIASDNISISYYRAYGLPVKIVRPFNTYGPRQSPRAVIPSIISQIYKNPKNIKLGNLLPTRDLTFVEDTSSAFLEIMNSKNLFGEVTNVGSNTEISIKDLLAKISSIMDTDIKFNKDTIRVRPEKSEVDRLFCNNDKILQNTNWMPLTNLDDGLKKTIKWVDKNLDYFSQSNKYII